MDVVVVIKKAIWIVTLLPTAFLAIRGFTLAIGQGSKAFGAIMTDFISLIIFWLLVAFGTIYLLSYIGTKIYERYTGKKIQSVSDTKEEPEEKTGNKISINININSSHFVNKDAKRAIAFFNGISGIIRESDKYTKRQAKAKREINESHNLD